jgi:galactokinase/mevalonate kinase-like predicted kinase
MIVTTSPLRISLGGGGTDLPSYYEEHGGFLMFYADDKVSLRHAMRECGLREVRFRFDFEGTKIIASE